MYFIETTFNACVATAPPVLGELTQDLVITSSPSPLLVYDKGDIISYQLTITNTGTVDVVDIAAVLGGSPITITSDPLGLLAGSTDMLSVGSSVVMTFDHLVTITDLGIDSIIKTSTVSSSNILSDLVSSVTSIDLERPLLEEQFIYPNGNKVSSVGGEIPWTVTGVSSPNSINLSKIAANKLDLAGSLIWESSVIDITGWTGISVNYSGAIAGAHDAGDSVVMEYRIDGGAWTAVFSKIGANPSQPVAGTVPVPTTGLNMEVRLAVENNKKGGNRAGGSEQFRFKYLVVYGL